MRSQRNCKKKHNIQHKTQTESHYLLNERNSFIFFFLFVSPLVNGKKKANRIKNAFMSANKEGVNKTEKKKQQQQEKQKCSREFENREKTVSAIDFLHRIIMMKCCGIFSFHFALAVTLNMCCPSSFISLYHCLFVSFYIYFVFNLHSTN